MNGRTWGLAAAAALTLALLPSPASASHVQSSTMNGATFTIQFDHDGDNEWWVEVLTLAGGGDTVTALEAQGEHDVNWHGMHAIGTVNGWTKWTPTQAFRVVPGDRVVFRAYMLDAATSQAGFVQSCPFTHPAGVEECGNPPPPPDWQVTPIGNAGIASGSGDMAIGDADNDGRRDVTTATRNGVFLFEWDGAAWHGQQVGDRSATYAVAVGDGNGDGRQEIYTTSNADLYRYTATAAGWTETHLATFPEPFPADMTLGNIDGIAGPELYVAMANGTAWSIYKVRMDTNGIVLDAGRIAGAAGHLESLWIGDGDRDGASELYVGHGTNHAAKTSRIRFVSGAWQFTQIDAAGSNYGEQFVVAGDGDRDGLPEIYSITDQGEFRRISFHPATGWNVQTPFSSIPSGSAPAIAPTGLFLGDGDGDGSDELYVTTAYGQLLQVRWDGSFWQVREAARPEDANGPGDAALAVVGDGDGDGRREAYLSVSFSTYVPPDAGHTEVFQVGVPRPAGFDATFTGVRGNEWWIQANVAATGGTLAGVDVRLNGGAWQPLGKQSWGGWAASYHAVQGTVVQFRATSTGGGSDLSDCYQWIPPSNTDAAKVACGTPPPPPPPPPSGFDATFANAKGNEWWVQVQAAPNAGFTVAQVDVRLNGGAWMPLDKQSWGPNDYAKSYHVVDGTKVQFRATATTGATDLSGCYRWIPPSGGVAATVAC